MTRVRLLRHFRTTVDADRPVEEWELTEDGEEAMAALLEADWIDGLDRVYSSPEHKALRTARAVAEEAGCPLVESEELREVDRSGEGFIEDHDAYVQMVHAYMREPTVPFDWEDRRDVEERSRAFIERIDADDDTVLVVGHGMQFTTMLAGLSDRLRAGFWDELGFGEVITYDLGELRDALR